MPSSQLSMELVRPCDRYYRKWNHSREKTIAVNVTGLFSQVSLVDVSMMQFSNFYKNFLFRHYPQKKIETLKRLRLLSENILIYICWNCAAGCVVMCVLLRQVAEKRKTTFSGKEFATLWLNEFNGRAQHWGWTVVQEGPSANSATVI